MLSYDILSLLIGTYLQKIPLNLVQADETFYNNNSFYTLIAVLLRCTNLKFLSTKANSRYLCWARISTPPPVKCWFHSDKAEIALKDLTTAAFWWGMGQLMRKGKNSGMFNHQSLLRKIIKNKPFLEIFLKYQYIVGSGNRQI